MLLRNTLTGITVDMPERMLKHPHFGQYLKKVRTAKPVVRHDNPPAEQANDQEQDD